MSSYPPPPPSTTDGTTQTGDSAQQVADPDSSKAQVQAQLQAQAQAHSHSQLHPHYNEDAAAAAAAAVAAAHHGLQALQAATAGPAPVPSPSPVTAQHASLADSSYSAGGGSASPTGVQNQKATRLRRACDMCSQRKVKVRASCWESLAENHVLTLSLAVRRDAAM